MKTGRTETAQFKEKHRGDTINKPKGLLKIAMKQVFFFISFFLCSYQIEKKKSSNVLKLQ